MNIPLLNLLGDAVLQKRQRRLRAGMIILYTAIWLFSITALIYTYLTNLYISNLYRRDIDRVQNEISLLQPKLLVIEQLYRQRRSVADKITLYQQAASRPSGWVLKLQAISRLIPSDVRLEEINVPAQNPAKSKNPANAGTPQMKMTGLSLIDLRQQDLNFLNIFKRNLEQDSVFISGFGRVEILQNRIDKKDGRAQMTFTLGVF